MRILLIALLLLLPIGAMAQVDHLGVLFSHTTSEGASGGNGTLNGIVFDGSYTVPKITSLKFVGDIKISRDYKGYLSETGTALRSKFLLRYAIPKGQGFFVDAGGSVSHVRFGNTSPTVVNGYSKTLKTWVFGIGNEFNYYDRVTMDANGHVSSVPLFSLTLGYQLFPSSHLIATDTNGNHSVVDGKSTTHRFNANASYEINHSHWLVLGNLSYIHSAYTRDCKLYGPVLCGEVHRSGVWEVQLGTGYRF